MNENANITLPLKEMERRIKKVMVQLPQKVGAEVVNFALDNFKRQAWLGDTIQPWKPRKNPNKWGQKPKRNGRAILVDAGHLRRSIRFMASWDQVRVFSNVAYARAHNDGVRLGLIQSVKPFTRKLHGIAKVHSIKTHKGRNVKVQMGEQNVSAHTRRINQNIPRRRFLGDSPYLRKRLQRLTILQLNKSFYRGT